MNPPVGCGGPSSSSSSSLLCLVHLPFRFKIRWHMMIQLIRAAANKKYELEHGRYSLSTVEKERAYTRVGYPLSAYAIAVTPVPGLVNSSHQSPCCPACSYCLPGIPQNIAYSMMRPYSSIGL
jgi:hypothetical protein